MGAREWVRERAGAPAEVRGVVVAAGRNVVDIIINTRLSLRLYPSIMIQSN